MLKMALSGARAKQNSKIEQHVIFDIFFKSKLKFKAGQAQCSGVVNPSTSDLGLTERNSSVGSFKTSKIHPFFIPTPYWLPQRRRPPILINLSRRFEEAAAANVFTVTSMVWG